LADRYLGIIVTYFLEQVFISSRFCYGKLSNKNPLFIFLYDICDVLYSHVTREGLGLGFTGQSRHMTLSSVNITSKMADNSESVASEEHLYFRHGYYMFISTIVSFQLLSVTLSKLGSPKSVV